jgi:hypothetical protein
VVRRRAAATVGAASAVAAILAAAAAAAIGKIYSKFKVQSFTINLELRTLNFEL